VFPWPWQEETEAWAIKWATALHLVTKNYKLQIGSAAMPNTSEQHCTFAFVNTQRNCIFSVAFRPTFISSPGKGKSKGGKGAAKGKGRPGKGWGLGVTNFSAMGSLARRNSSCTLRVGWREVEKINDINATTIDQLNLIISIQATVYCMWMWCCLFFLSFMCLR